jgi:hypothetical protein
MLLSFEANSQSVWERETGFKSPICFEFFLGMADITTPGNPWQATIQQQFRGFLRASDLGIVQNGKPDGLLKGKDIIAAFGRVGRLAMHGG